MLIITIGERLRQIREQKKLPLRRIAQILNIDISILSKMERGERKITKEIVFKLAGIYNYDTDELLVLFLSDKILLEIKNEELGEKALKITEKRIKSFKIKNA
ncbi:Helix-turn-helix [Chryseobacterium oleae]|uniref:Helix-turn-helix n=1 Tax=Chryseobacterium oleae TaxID=491207 RepID=A0A1I4YX32_CHROL|nr:helix-turn-helix domain-containing protein [Chryseobacterium oleae]SFN42229.1 Helix-turn-helix [Chryseobacterium oleae]